MEPILLENWRYLVEMGCGVDTWRLYGEVYGHPRFREGRSVFVSTPKSLDKEKRLITTASGKVYQLGNCAANEDEQFQYIEADISNGGTERW